MAGKNNLDIRAGRLPCSSKLSPSLPRARRYLPTFSVDYFFGLQANQLALHDLEGHNLLGSSVAAQVTIPIWNWGATKSKVKQAQLELQLAKNDLSLTQRTLLSNLDSYYREAQVATSQIASLCDSLTLSAENLAVDAAALYRRQSTAQEVVDAQNALVQARNAFDDGLVRYRLALANLQTLTGAF